MRKLSCALALVAIALTCSIAAPAAGATGTAKVRVVHNFFNAAIPQPATVDIRVGPAATAAQDLPTVATVSYGDITDYIEVPAAPTNYRIAVFAAGTDTLIAELTQWFGPDARATVLAQPASTTDSSFSAKILWDGWRKPGATTANVRAIHGIPAAAADGVRVGAVGVGCVSGPVSYGDQLVINVPAGTYDIAVFAPTDTNCSQAPLPGLTLDDVTLVAGTAYTAIAQFAVAPATGFQLQPAVDFAAA